MKIIRVGMVGAGQIARKHMGEYRKIPGVELVAICSGHVETARAAAEEWGIPNVCRDYKELIARQDLDVVDVCVHNRLHAAIVIDALNAGHNVYCEKPLSSSYADGKAMVEAAERSGRLLHIQLARLYWPETRAAKRLVDGGALGDIYYAKAVGFRRRNRPYVDGYGTPSFVKKEISAGGAVLDMMVYQVSRMLYLLGNPRVERISGRTFQKTGMYEDRREKSGYDVEEFGTGFVRFANGAVMHVDESWAIHLPELGASCMAGDKGGVLFDPFRFSTTLCDLELDCTGHLPEMERRWLSTDDREIAYTSSEQHLIAALRGVVTPIDTAHLALNTLLIQEGIYLSERLGREVSAREVEELSEKTV